MYICGADLAAYNGHLHIVQYLRQFQGVKCTSNGIDVAAARGHMDIVEYLDTQGIRCTDWGANLAAKNGYYVYSYLQRYGVW